MDFGEAAMEQRKREELYNYFDYRMYIIISVGYPRSDSAGLQVL
jgi:hypothetical protein